MSLKDLLNLRNKPTEIVKLKDEFEKYLNLLPMIAEDDRKTGVLHPSTISQISCSRAWCLLDMFAKEINDFDAQTILTLGVGTKIHELLQEYLSSMGILYGLYSCNECERKCKTYSNTSSIPCGNGNNPKWQYNEINVVDEELNIYGHTDGILILPNITNAKFILELKSSNSRVFGMLEKPLDYHIRQAMIYMYVLENNRVTKIISGDYEEIDLIPFKGIFIWYFNKNDSSIKEFFIPFDEKVYEYIDSLRPLIAEFNEFLETRKLPPRTCANKTEASKLGCKAKIKCFELEG